MTETTDFFHTCRKCGHKWQENRANKDHCTYCPECEATIQVSAWRKQSEVEQENPYSGLVSIFDWAESYKKLQQQIDALEERVAELEKPTHPKPSRARDRKIIDGYIKSARPKSSKPVLKPKPR